MTSYIGRKEQNAAQELDIEIEEWQRKHQTSYRVTFFAEIMSDKKNK